MPPQQLNINLDDLPDQPDIDLSSLPDVSPQPTVRRGPWWNPIEIPAARELPAEPVTKKLVGGIPELFTQGRQKMIDWTARQGLPPWVATGLHALTVPAEMVAESFTDPESFAIPSFIKGLRGNLGKITPTVPQQAPLDVKRILADVDQTLGPTTKSTAITPEILPAEIPISAKISEGGKIPDFSNIAENGSIWVDNMYGKGFGGYARPEDLNFIYDTARMRKQPLPEPPPEIKSKMNPSVFGETIRDISPTTVVEAPSATLPKTTPPLALPKDLQGAKPRFNIGQTTYEPAFQSDVDKALYIIAQKNPSKRDADYLAYVMKATGLDEGKARQLGHIVRNNIKAIVSGHESGAVDIPPIWERITKAIPKPPTNIPSVARAIEPPPPIKPPIGPSSNIPEEIPDVVKMAGGRIREPGLIGKMNSFAKSTLTSYDISAPGRQALPLWHTKEFWTSWDDMFKAWGSENAFNKIQEGIQQKPLFQKTISKAGKEVNSYAEEVGLDLTDLFTNREERFMSQFADKWVPLVRRSNRAHVAFLNKLRADHFETLIEAAEKAGLSPKQNIVLGKQIADFVNGATGRGSLGKLEKHAELLSEYLFAPKFYASRLRTLNPMTYLNPKIDPFVRKQSLKSLIALGTAAAATTQLGRLAGADVSPDPTSSDFGKIKIGKSRLDPHAGHQQYVVLGSRLMSSLAEMYIDGKRRDYGKFGKRTPLDASIDFALGKLNPVQSFIAAMMRGTDFDTKPFEFKKAAIQRMAPIITQDAYDLFEEDPSLLWMLVPSAVGMGIQTYGK